MNRPLNNYVLVELQREYAGVSRAESEDELKTGILRDYSISKVHLTASSAARFDTDIIESLELMLKGMLGKTVRWEQFAEGGQTFIEDGKTYALIPWWRLISVEGE